MNKTWQSAICQGKIQILVMFWISLFPLSLFMYLFGSTKGQSQGLVNAIALSYTLNPKSIYGL